MALVTYERGPHGRRKPTRPRVTVTDREIGLNVLVRALLADPTHVELLVDPDRPGVYGVRTSTGGSDNAFRVSSTSGRVHCPRFLADYGIPKGSWPAWRRREDDDDLPVVMFGAC